MKRLLRRIPELATIYCHAKTLLKIAYERWWADPQLMNDHSILSGEWHFEAPAEQERYQRVLAAVTKQRGDGSWGDVLEFGCAEGLMTKELGRRSTSVTACDVSSLACERAAQCCAELPHVRVQRLNIDRDPIHGSFDLAFVMGVLEFVHGRGRLGNVGVKLAGAMRTGGLLILNEVRLPPEMEKSWWACWLAEGGLQGLKFLDGRCGFRLVHQEIYPRYVICIFEKTLQISTRGWKRFIPSNVRRAYHFGRLSMRFLRGLDFNSWDAFRESWRASGTIFRIREDSLIDAAWLKSLHRLAGLVDREGIRGDFVECGVYRGGSATVLADAFRRSTYPRHLWLFDSFQGLPRPTRADGPSAPALEGDIVGNQENLTRLLRRVDAPLDRVHIFAGWFHETFPSAPISRVAVLHIDADWYESVKLCLDHFYDLLEPGGIVILDDYEDWPGCKAALEEFVGTRSLRISLQGGGKEQYYFRKGA